MKNRKAILELFELAAVARENAYVPISNYKVGAALVDDLGAIHTGCNVEVANLKGGTCAETTSIAKMVSAGQYRIAAIAVVGSGSEPCPPCGHCRQLIREFADANTRIYVQNPVTKVIRSYSIEQLLPDSFGPNNLKSNL